MKKITKSDLIILIVTIIAAIGAVVTVCLMNFLPDKIPMLDKDFGVNLLDSSFCYNSTELYEYLGKLNNRGLNTLLQIHSIDYLFMICVLVLEVGAVLLLSNRKFWLIFINAFAFLEFLFDLSENVMVDLVIKALPDKKPLLSSMCGGMTCCKWVFTILYLVSFFVAVGYLVFKNVKQKKASEQSKE